MDANRENYYVLLGLKGSVSDRQAIEAKINEMEKKWKDLVTKLGRPEHKRYLELVPDIRKRMLNPDTRAKEAKAAVIISAIDPSLYEAARKALPETYQKIEEGLAHAKVTDMYDFLSRDPASGQRRGRYRMEDRSDDLTERAKELMDAYRNLPDAVDKMRLVSLLVDFIGSGHKEAYDAYIMMTVKKSLAYEVDTVVKYNGNTLNKENLSKLTSEFTRLFFPQNDVAEFIQAYCEYKGYAVTKAPTQPSPSVPQPAKAQETPAPPKPDKVPLEQEAGNLYKDYARLLQQNIGKLKLVVNKQHEQINSLKVKEKGTDARAPQHKEYRGHLKGAILHQFAFKEYMDITSFLARGQVITDKEQSFYDLYKQMLRGETAQLEQKMSLWAYLQSRYGQQINELTAPSADEVTDRMAVTFID